MRIMSLLHLFILINQSLVMFHIIYHLSSQILSLKGSTAFLQVFYPSLHFIVLSCF